MTHNQKITEYYPALSSSREDQPDDQPPLHQGASTDKKAAKAANVLQTSGSSSLQIPETLPPIRKITSLRAADKRMSSSAATLPSIIPRRPNAEPTLGAKNKGLSSSASTLPGLTNEASQKIMRPITRKEKVLERDARPTSPALPIRRARAPLPASRSSPNVLGDEKDSILEKPERSIKNENKQIIEDIFRRHDTLPYLELKKALLSKKRPLRPKEQEAFELTIPLCAPPNFSIYYLNSCTDPFFNFSPLSCTPKDFLSYVVISLRKTPGCRDRRPQGAIYADFFRRTRRQLWTDYGFALMGNASDYDILEFLKILHDSRREKVTEFCFKFQAEWIHNLLRAGRLIDVLQKAHEKELEDSVTNWKQLLFDRKGMTNLLSQGYLDFINRPFAAEQSRNIMNAITKFPEWTETLWINTDDMRTLGWKHKDDREMLRSNQQNFKTVLVKCLLELCRQQLPQLNQLVLTIRRTVVENYFPRDRYPDLAKRFALDFLIHCLAKEFKYVTKKSHGDVNSPEKSILHSFWESLSQLKEFLEENDMAELKEKYPILFEVWNETQEELNQFIENNTQLSLKTWSPHPSRWQ